jgi:CYTH domain-containing protein/predicted ATPase
MNSPRIKKIVLTGGPCAGKTKVLPQIVERFSSLGWTVLIGAETASILIQAGLKPSQFNQAERITFQKALVGLQVAAEEALSHLAAVNGKTLIVFDRGIFDARAYLPLQAIVWNSILAAHNLNEITGRDQRYDGVIHMTSAAIGAEEFYTLANNPARQEVTIAEAAASDLRTLDAWQGHPHLREIRNIDSNGAPLSFDTKASRVLREIALILGEPTPTETERRFLVRRRDSMPLTGETFEIFQHYLVDEPGREIRIRRRGRNGHWLFTRTEKRTTDIPGTRIESEEIISAETYLELLGPPDRIPYVHKERTCRSFEGHYLEIDRFLEPDLDALVLEIETDEKGQLSIPPELEVIREITGNPIFSNKALARNPFQMLLETDGRAIV